MHAVLTSTEPVACPVPNSTAWVMTDKGAQRGWEKEMDALSLGKGAGMHAVSYGSREALPFLPPPCLQRTRPRRQPPGAQGSSHTAQTSCALPSCPCARLCQG